MQDYGYFGPESVTWKIAHEAVITLSWPRAVLMQLAHPLVATGVSTHSSYTKDPLSRSKHTFMMSQKLVFGSTTTAQQAARSINHLHAHVYGTLPAAVGDYVAGSTYHASDPELLLWVHATLVDSALLTYPLLVGPLNNEEQEQYYQESKTIAGLLGLAHEDMPGTVNDLRRYVHEMIYSNHLAATPQGRQFVRQVLFPVAVSDTLRPLLYLNFYITCALLPQPIREIYGLEWGKKRQLIFDLATRGLRATIPHLPAPLRIFSITRKLMQEGTAA